MTAWRTPAAAALAHARRGWVVVPLKPGTNMPARKWKNLTSTPPGAVAAHWPGPQHNPGILTGPSGLTVVDLDSAEHGTEISPEWAALGVTCGAEVLAVLADRACERIPGTYEVISWRGGRHLYFRTPPGAEIRNSVSKVGPMTDIRGCGGMVVGAGSIRNGKPYELTDDRDPVTLPAWLAELAVTRPAAGRRTDNGKPATPLIPGRGYAAAALRGEVDAVLAATRGHRNDALNRAAFALGQLVGSADLDEGEVTAALMSAAGSIGLVADDGLARCERTITSGLTAGTAQPRVRRAA